MKSNRTCLVIGMVAALLVTTGLSFLCGWTARAVDLPQRLESALNFSTPTATLAPTLEPSATPQPSATPTLSPTFAAMNIQEYPGFTVYWDRGLWESALASSVSVEDFELETGDYGELNLPYLTKHGFYLVGGSCSGQILPADGTFSSGNYLHVRYWGCGLTCHLPGDASGRAFGFDYRASEPWVIMLGDTELDLPDGRAGFIGIVVNGERVNDFTITSFEYAQGGISVDNITYSLVSN